MSGLVGRNHVCVGQRRKFLCLCAVPRCEDAIGFDENLQCPQDGGSEIGLIVQELRKQLRERAIECLEVGEKGDNGGISKASYVLAVIEPKFI